MQVIIWLCATFVQKLMCNELAGSLLEDLEEDQQSLKRKLELFTVLISTLKALYTVVLIFCEVISFQCGW